MAVSRKDDKGLPAVWQLAQEEGEDGLRRRAEGVAQQVLLVVEISAEGYREVLERLREITQARRLVQARRAREEAGSALAPRHPQVARLLEEQGEEILGVYQLPQAHRRRLRSTNLLQRLSQQIKRRTRVCASFPTKLPVSGCSAPWRWRPTRSGWSGCTSGRKKDRLQRRV